MIVPKPDADPFYRKELIGIVQAEIDRHPRSAQAQIGPSEVGGCQRKVAHKLAYGGDSDREGGWAAAKGTVLHAWLDAEVFGSDRAPLMPDGSQRFYSDLKLESVSPYVNGGTLDLYDKMRETVVDHKLPGDWTCKAVRAGRISEAYYVQIQLYGMGLEQAGHKVSRVALFFLPMAGDDLSGNSRGAILVTWPYDRQVAQDAIDKIRKLQLLAELDGWPKTIESQPMKSDFCSSCPAYIGSSDRRATCPGAEVSKPVRPERDPSNPFA